MLPFQHNAAAENTEMPSKCSSQLARHSIIMASITLTHAFYLVAL